MFQLRYSGTTTGGVFEYRKNNQSEKNDFFLMKFHKQLNRIFFQVNTDNCKDVAGDYNIPAGEKHPTFVHYNGGRKGFYHSLYADDNIDELKSFSGPIGW